MKRYAEALRLAEDYTQQGHLLEALRVRVSALAIEAIDLINLLAIADLLDSQAETRTATRTLSAVVRWGAHAAHPILALVALKRLMARGTEFDSLAEALAALYASDSTRLGATTRLRLSDPDGELGPAFQVSGAALPELVHQVIDHLSADTEARFSFPAKLPPIPVLSDLEAPVFCEALRAITLERVPAGVTVIREGEAGAAFYIVGRGLVEVWRGREQERSTLAQLHAGAIFGEMSLVTDQPRSASVTALEATDLLCLGRDALIAANPKLPVIAKALENFAHRRAVENLVNRAQLFAPLDAQQRLDLLRRFVAFEGKAGATWIRQGDQGEGLYLVVSGRVSVVQRQADGCNDEVAQLGPGEVFGEISLLYEVPATASVISQGQTTVLFLKRKYVQKLLEALPELRTYVESLGEERMLVTRLTASVPPPPSREPDDFFLWT